MRSLTLTIGVLVLSACGTTKQVGFANRPTAPAAEQTPASTSASTPAPTPKDAVATAAVPPTPIIVEVQPAPKAVVADERLHDVLVDYRADAEALLTLIWKKPVAEVTDVGTLDGYVHALNRVIKINLKLQKQSHLEDADHRMLTEGVEVMESVRGTLTARRTQLSKAATPN